MDLAAVPPAGIPPRHSAGRRGGFIFAIIEFAFVIVPFVFLELRPDSTRRRLKVAQDWITGHVRQRIAIAVIIAGTYTTVTGLIPLS